MGLFDRWTSQKGKTAKGAPSKAEREDEAKRQTFASVPGATNQPAPEAKKPESKNDVSSKPAAEARSTDRADRVLGYPIVTEKSNRQPGQYTFIVSPSASKLDVRNAVHQVYGVRPVAVNILNHAGQGVRYGRFVGRHAGRRKAVVRLPAGKTIDLNA